MRKSPAGKKKCLRCQVIRLSVHALSRVWTETYEKRLAFQADLHCNNATDQRPPQKIISVGAFGIRGIIRQGGKVPVFALCPINSISGAPQADHIIRSRRDQITERFPFQIFLRPMENALAPGHGCRPRTKHKVFDAGVTCKQIMLLFQILYSSG